MKGFSTKFFQLPDGALAVWVNGRRVGTIVEVQGEHVVICKDLDYHKPSRYEAFGLDDVSRGIADNKLEAVSKLV